MSNKTQPESNEARPDEANAEEQVKAVIRRLQSRKIRFRAWNEAAKEMEYPSEQKLFGGFTDGDIIDKFEIIMQYTGVNDKNGNHIYEADVLENVIGDRRIVYFNEGSFGVNAMPFIQIDSNNIEIIGNIFENPELLTHCK